MITSINMKRLEECSANEKQFLKQRKSKEEQTMKQSLIKAFFTIVLVFSVAMPLYASAISYNGLARYQCKNEITITEPLVIFDTVAETGFTQRDLAAFRIMLARYDKGCEAANAIALCQPESPAPAPVPEPLSLLLFGTGMIGAGYLVRRRAAYQSK
jgi:hypothetical protein